MQFTIESCVREHHFSKQFCTPEVGRLGDSNDVYAVAVEPDATKTFQIKRNNDLSSFQLHFITNFVLTEPKLAHGQVKFPARSISHFVLNIIMAKTGHGSTATSKFC